MGWLTFPREPEPEVMDEDPEVEAYASAAAQAYLDSIDDTLVEQVLSAGPRRGLLLDIGTGPGGIPLKIARRLPEMRVVGIDRSAGMIQVARRAALDQDLASRALFFVGDATPLCFPHSHFNLVLSNSFLNPSRAPPA